MELSPDDQNYLINLLYRIIVKRYWDRCAGRPRDSTYIGACRLKILHAQHQGLHQHFLHAPGNLKGTQVWFPVCTAVHKSFGRVILGSRKGNLKGGNLLRQPSCHHVWSRVIVPRDFFVSKPAKQVWVVFPTWNKSRAHIGYCTMNHAVTIRCADHTKWLCQIQRYNIKLTSIWDGNMAAAP